MKAFAADLRTIYNAASEDEGQKARDRVVENGQQNIRTP